MKLKCHEIVYHMNFWSCQVEWIGKTSWLWKFGCTSWLWKITARSSRLQEKYPPFLKNLWNILQIYTEKTRRSQHETGWAWCTRLLIDYAQTLPRHWWNASTSRRSMPNQKQTKKNIKTSKKRKEKTWMHCAMCTSMSMNVSSKIVYGELGNTLSAVWPLDSSSHRSDSHIHRWTNTREMYLSTQPTFESTVKPVKSELNLLIGMRMDLDH